MLHALMAWREPVRGKGLAESGVVENGNGLRFHGPNVEVDDFGALGCSGREMVAPVDDEFLQEVVVVAVCGHMGDDTLHYEEVAKEERVGV